VELTDGCYSEGDSQGLPGQGLFTPVSLGYPLSVFNTKLYSQPKPKKSAYIQAEEGISRLQLA